MGSILRLFPVLQRRNIDQIPILRKRKSELDRLHKVQRWQNLKHTIKLGLNRVSAFTTSFTGREHIFEFWIIVKMRAIFYVVRTKINQIVNKYVLHKQNFKPKKTTIIV